MMDINDKLKVWDKFLPTIRIKVIGVFFTLIFIPLIILAMVTYARVSEDYRSNIEYAADQSFEQAVGFISFKVNTLINSSDVIYFNPEVQTIMKRDRESIEEDNVQQYKDNIFLERLIFSLKNDQDVYRVKLYVADWLTYSDEDYYFSSISDFRETEAYNRLKDYRGKVIWMPPYEVPEDDNVFRHVNVIPVVRRIRDIENVANTIAFMELSLLQSTMDDIIDKADVTEKGMVFLFNSHDELLASTDETDLSKVDQIIEYIKQVKESSSNGEWMAYKEQESLLNIRYESIDNTDWYLVSVIPENEIVAPANKIRRFITILYISGGLIAFSLALILSSSLTSRIHHLSDHMLKVQDGQMNVISEDKSQDEIGQLNRSFNYMLEEIRLLLDKQYRAGQELKNAELKALQAQINPHFLYNTLDMINWKAMDSNAPEIGLISQTLAKFYKLSLSKGMDIVTIRDEISHVEQYVKIQNMRYEDRIGFRVDVDERILDHKIPKIILQPLIENAILHGILKRTGEGGLITIRGWITESDIILQIKDDGMGIEKAKLDNILLSGDTVESHGYGVRNIHERLRLSYGTSYGLSYESQLSKWTLVTVRIPTKNIK